MRLEFARSWVRFPAGLRCVFSSDPAVSSSIFVGAERESLSTMVVCLQAVKKITWPSTEKVAVEFSAKLPEVSEGSLGPPGH